MEREGAVALIPEDGPVAIGSFRKSRGLVPERWIFTAGSSAWEARLFVSQSLVSGATESGLKNYPLAGHGGGSGYYPVAHAETGHS